MLIKPQSWCARLKTRTRTIICRHFQHPQTSQPWWGSGARKYSVFHLIWTQELGYCELDLGLLRSQRASMWPQDWAEITFRSETHRNKFYSEPRKCLKKERIARSGDLRWISRVSQKCFAWSCADFFLKSLQLIIFFNAFIITTCKTKI